MSKIIEKIQFPIRKEMEIFEEKFHNEIKSQVPLLDKIAHYIIYRKGKQMRPMFTFFIAKMIGGKILEKTYQMASLIELIHTATLVHDDVVDESYLRRGFFSINALWKNKIAVLIGDYLLSKSLLLASEHKNQDLLKVIAQAIKQMSEGELFQLEKSRLLDITESQYYQIIENKTASLIIACSKGGAISVNANDENIKKMQEFGKLVGMAFQIKDDLFDYQKSSFTGKPIGIDIKERKMTLPLIYALEKASAEDKKWLLNSIKNHNKDKKRVKEVIDYIKKSSGGVEYAKEKITEFSLKALEILNFYPDSEAKNSLKLMIKYVIERKH